MKYLTPTSLRAMGTGLPLTGVGDADLAGLIEEAEGLIDAEAALDERNALGFGSGQRTEAQLWDPATRRVNFSAHPVPVRAVQSFTIQYGQNPGDGSPIVATIPPTEVVVNNDYGYGEVITIAVILAGLVPVLAFTGVIEPIARYTYTAGYAVQKTAWRLFFQPPADLSGPLWHSRLPFWDSTAPVVVTRNGATLAAGTDYTVDYEDGSVSITTGYSLSDQIRATFVHTVPDPLVQIAKQAFREVYVEYAMNQAGMAGAESVTIGTTKRQRQRSVGQKYPDYGWRQALQGFKAAYVVSA